MPRHRVDQRGPVARQALGQVHDHRAEGPPGRLVRAQHGDSSIYEVLLVVPRGGQDGSGRPAKADHVRGPGARPSQLVKRLGRAVPQFLVRSHRRHLGGRVTGDLCEHPGVDGQCPPQPRPQHQRRHRASSVAGQASRPEELGHPVDSHEGNCRHPAPPPTKRPHLSRCEEPPRRHPTWFEGTTTLTSARASSPLALCMAWLKACAAGRPTGRAQVLNPTFASLYSPPPGVP